MRTLFIALTALLLTACMSMNDAMTPDASVRTDDFDGSKEVIQKPVSAASSISEGWNTLGFRWNSQAPTVVYLTAGAEGITNVSGLKFNVDGEFITASEASTLTDYDQWSTRQFAVSWEQFLKIANGKVVKMRIEKIDTYQNSSFGTENSGGLVNKKFPPFIAKVKQIMASEKK